MIYLTRITWRNKSGDCKLDDLYVTAKNLSRAYKKAESWIRKQRTFNSLDAIRIYPQKYGKIFEK